MGTRGDVFARARAVVPVLFFAWLGVMALACGGGATMGERAPGRDKYVEPGAFGTRDDAGVLYNGDAAVFTDAGGFNPAAASLGAIAVDDRDEAAFVMQAFPITEGIVDGGWGRENRTLWRVRPDGEVREVGRFDDSRDARVLFPSSGVLVMTEPTGGACVDADCEQLRLYERGSLRELARRDVPLRYHGTRMSGTRRYIAVADNTAEHAPIHIIDALTLESHVIPHGGDWLEAMWLNRSDRLLAVVFDDRGARILAWDVPLLANHGFAVEDQVWARPSLDLRVPGVSADGYFSYTWVGVSPDDRYAVFPVLADVSDAGVFESTHRLLVLDLLEGSLRTVNDARGPVGFTPDGSTIVSYRANPAPILGPDRGGPASLVLIDARSLESEVITLPFEKGRVPTFFVTREGHRVAVTDNGRELVLYDLEMRRLTRVEGDASWLGEFVSRLGHNELYLLDDGLHRLDLSAETLSRVTLDWTPRHINILPARDQLVLDRPGENALSFWDLSTQSLSRTVTLPVPTPR
ncbi:MAG: hypothetical protein R3A52_05430 [Polyangiales bacterium]